MPPDLNSLPPSRSPPSAISPLQTRSMTSSNQEAFRNQTPSPSSNSPSHSLAAAAALNAGIQHEESRRSSNSSIRNRATDRRRSSVRINLNLNDPTLPGPGELQMSPGSRMHAPHWPASPHHQRAPSLGELHQELENEQEAQVNRLLSMIRQQQAQIQALQASSSAAAAHASNTAVIDDSTPTSEHSPSLPQSSASAAPAFPPAAAAASSFASYAPHQQPTHQPPVRSRSPFPISRQSSYASRSHTSSQTGSPALRPMSSSHGEGGEWLLAGSGAGAAGSRDESAFYQAETQMLTRENQMLKLRIRELERQLSDLSPTHPVTHSPVTASNLASPPMESAEAGATGQSSGEQPKE